MSNDDILITNKSELDCKHKFEHENYEYYKYEIQRFSQDNPYSFAIYEIPSGKSNYQYHFHVKNHEFFYIISGEGMLKTHLGDKIVKKGDIIVCPPTEKGAHKLTNLSQNEMLVYLEFDTINFPEAICYPDSDKIGVFLNDKDKKFYKLGTEVDYFDGE